MTPGSDHFLAELFRGTQGPIYFCVLRNNKSKLPATSTRSKAFAINGIGPNTNAASIFIPLRLSPAQHSGTKKPVFNSLQSSPTLMTKIICCLTVRMS